MRFIILTRRIRHWRVIDMSFGETRLVCEAGEMYFKGPSNAFMLCCVML